MRQGRKRMAWWAGLGLVWTLTAAGEPSVVSGGEAVWPEFGQERSAGAERVDFSRLPLERAIAMVHGAGARKIVSFEDSNCAYCKKLMRELEAVDDVTVYVFLYPILEGDSWEKSRQIWCAPDRARAWRAWMLEGKEPASASPGCDASALEHNLALGRRLGISVVPTIVLPSGRRIPGLIRAPDLMDFLSRER